jgi:deoxyribose-phosphate aldolase
MTPSQSHFAAYFDHTLLRADALPSDFEILCGEAARYGFKSVAINPVNVKLCRELLRSTGVLVGAAIAFPLGQTTLKTKLFETSDAIEDGAQEIDYVCNVGRVRAGDCAYIKEEMRGIVGICRDAGITVKVIFENCYLTRDQIAWLSQISSEVRPDFIKTSTGFGKSGATVEDVVLMAQNAGPGIAVKAAGGVRTLEFAEKLIAAGATRLGSSSGVSIMEELILRDSGR